MILSKAKSAFNKIMNGLSNSIERFHLNSAAELSAASTFPISAVLQQCFQQDWESVSFFKEII